MKIFTGKVISTKMLKTATVAVERVVIHPLYKKRFKRDTKYQVHDELGTVVGQTVKFTACKPYSKTKKWKIIEITSDKSQISEEKSKIKGQKSKVQIKNKKTENKEGGK